MTEHLMIYRRIMQAIITRPFAALALVIGLCIGARHVYGMVTPIDPEANDFYLTGAEYIVQTGRLDGSISGFSAIMPSGNVMEFVTPFDRPPVYMLLLAVARRVFGTYETGIPALQFGLWVSLLLLTYTLAQAVFQRRGVSLLAVLIAGLYPYLLSNSLLASDQIITGALFLGMALAAVRLIRTQRFFYAVAFGVLVAVESLTRGLSVAFAPLLIGYLLLTMKPVKKALIAGLCVVGSAAMLLLPWVTYTNSVYGAPVLVTGGGLRVWQGNNPYLHECGYPINTIDLCPFSTPAAAYLPEGTEEALTLLSAPERDRYMMQLGLNYMISDPGLTLRRMLTKLNAVWSPLYNPTFTTNGAHVSRMKQAIYTLTYTPIMLLAFMGMVWAWRRNRSAVMVCVCVCAAFSAYSALLWGHTFHKLFLMPLLIVFAAYGAEVVFKFWMHRSGKHDITNAR